MHKPRERDPKDPGDRATLRRSRLASRRSGLRVRLSCVLRADEREHSSVTWRHMLYMSDEIDDLAVRLLGISVSEDAVTRFAEDSPDGTPLAERIHLRSHGDDSYNSRPFASR